jgi:hypothetical protein
MKKLVIILSVFLGIALSSGTATAQIEEKNVISGKFKFDPEMGYMFIAGSTRQTGVFLKAPSPIEIEEYTADWEKGFAKAQKKYAKQLDRWKSDSQLAKQTKTKVPEKPIEPTRENFSIGDIETRNVVSFGPEYVFSKDKEKSNYTYMMQVKPGIYTYHGPLFFNPNAGYLGACYCMGSVQFEVKAGIITDIGNFLIAAPTEDMKFGLAKAPMVVPTGLFTSKVNVEYANTAVKFGLPESLAKYPSAVADFRAAGKVDNFFGVMISRMPPIPGVLGYQRDKVVDLKAVSASTTETTSAQAIPSTMQ